MLCRVVSEGPVSQIPTTLCSGFSDCHIIISSVGLQIINGNVVLIGRKIVFMV